MVATRPSQTPSKALRAARQLRVLRPWVLLTAGFLFALGVAVVGWPWARATKHLTAARRALGRGDLSAAMESLELAQTLRPERAEVQYLLAVANRRAGRLDRFEAHLERASKSGWREDDVQRQRWLATAQTGDVQGVEAQLRQTIARGASDDVAEEIYEALAKGHLATYRMHEAWRCVDFWLHWRPRATQARMLRAGIFKRMRKLAAAADDYRAVLEELPEYDPARTQLGEVLLRANRLEEAREHFRSWLAAAPDGVDALLGMAQCENRLGLSAEARRHLEAALGHDLTPQQRATALLEQGKLFLSDGKAGEAVDVLMQAVRLMPAESSVHYALAKALTAAGESGLARYHLGRVRHIQAQFQRMSEITERVIDAPNDAELRSEAGAILIEQGLKREGVGWLLSALKCDPKHEPARRLLGAEGHFRTGMKALAEGDLDAARAAAKALRGIDTYAPHMHMLEGILLSREGRLPEALLEFGHAKDHPDTRALACALSGEVLYKLKQYGAAQGILITAIKLDPSLTDARRWLAASYHDIGAMDHALEQLAVVAQQAPEDPRPYRLSGLILKDYENYADAIFAYRESLKRNPSPPEKDQIMLELAECLVKQQQHAEALETLRKCPRSADVLALEAQCYYAQGDKAAARKRAGEALQRDPHRLDAMELQAAMDLEANDAESAVRILRQAVEHHPKDFRVRYRLAQAYQRAGQRELAEEQLKLQEDLRELRKRFTQLHKEAIADPSNAETRYQLGLVARQLDEPELARDWFVAAIGMDPNHTGAREALEGMQRPPETSAGDSQ